MIFNPEKRRHYALVVLALSLLFGGWLRFSGLEARSVTHPEIYVPRIPLPQGISEPTERFTARSVLTGTFSSDTHPPGYYLFMLPWTRVAGTSLWAMRVPSAVLGTLSIALVYVLGTLVIGPVAGATAAALVALSGYHVFWSQVARMFSLACFLGLAATLLIVLIARGAHHWSLRVLYLLLILAGVATHVFFWALFAMHLLWAFGNALGRPHMPALCRTLLTALILGSPFIAFAAYQSATPVAELSRDGFQYAREFFSFGFLLPSAQSGFFASAVPLTTGIGTWAVRPALLLVSILLLIYGVRALRKPAAVELSPEAPRGPKLAVGAYILAALAATAAIATFLSMSSALPAGQLHATIRLTRRLLILPGLLAITALALDHWWARLKRFERWRRYLAGERRLVILLGCAPILLLIVASQFRPLLNQRGLMLLVPYLLLLLAAGLVALPRRNWVPALALLLAAACVGSVTAYRTMTVDPIDYNGFVSKVQPQIGPRDLVFVRKAYYETPLFYYLNPQKYRLIGRDFRHEASAHPSARIWVVLLYNLELTPEMKQAVAGYRVVQSITAPHAKAFLYELGPEPPNPLWPTSQLLESKADL